MARPRAFNIIRFGARQTKQGVSAAPWRKRRVYRKTFIANKGRTVFVRMTRNRLPIKSIKGPSVRVEFTRKYAELAIRRVGDARFAIELRRALRIQT